MHFFIPRLDYKMIDSMALPSGGGKQKMTTDGWRNAYAGYNSYFKSLGILAKLDQNNVEKAKFTSEDAYQVTKGLAGYVRMDSILTRRSKFGEAGGRRPGIPWGEMKNSYSVVSGGTTVFDDRKQVDLFVKDLLKEYGYSEDKLEEMLFSTQEFPVPSKKQEDLAENHSEALQGELMRAVEKQGTEKMKNVLMRYIDKFTDPQSAEGYDYDSAKKLWLEGQDAQHATAA